MPVKWTPDNDQLLLLKILETHDLKVDTKKLVDAWPKDKGEAPTERAIKERLVKIRQNSKEGGGQAFPISAAQSSPAKASPNKTPSSGGIRKKTSSHGTAASTPTKRRKCDVTSDGTSFVKPEPQSDGEDDVVELSAGPVTPTPQRSFVQTTSPMVHSFDNSFGNGNGSAASFLPAQTSMRNMSAAWDDNRESQFSFGYDGANDYYSSFNDEMAV